MVYFICYPIVFVILRLLLRVLGRARSSGEHNVPRTGAVIYCPNHVSDADPPTLFACAPRRAWYLGKRELFETPVVGWFFRHFRGIPITRDSADRAALRRAEDVLRRGEPLVIFPEGRCSQDGLLGRLQPGAAMLAVRTGAPIVPIALRYTNEMLPYGATFPRYSAHAVQIEFGPPILASEFLEKGHRGAIEAITARLRSDLLHMTGQVSRA